MGKSNPEKRAHAHKSTIFTEARFSSTFSSTSGKKSNGTAMERGVASFGLLQAAGDISPTPAGGAVNAMSDDDSSIFRDAIGKELRALYDDVVSQPIPDRFLTLISQLESNVLSSPPSPDGAGENE